MIRSMTAFANNDTQFANLSINCEIRSVNHRYCDIYLKLPETLRFLESDLRRTIAEPLKRGKIECLITIKKNYNDTESELSINLPALKALLATTAEIEQHMHSSRSFSALEVLSFPGIQVTPELDKDQLKASILELVAQTLSKLQAEREREGEQTALFINQKCEQITSLVKAAKMKAPEALQQIRKKLLDRVSEIVTAPDHDRLEQEFLILAQKMDINEEIERLATHNQEVQRLLSHEQPVGRRLDFLMQELNREANTLSSKSPNIELTQISIELKVLIEQIREQIQNIE